MARMNSRQMWTAKLQGKPVPSRTAPTAGSAAGARRLKQTFVGLVLGIDPSLRGTGLALIEFPSGRAPVLERRMFAAAQPAQPREPCPA